MKCTSPIFLKNNSFGHFTLRKDTSGNIHSLDGYFVPCGQCIACRLNYAKMWSIRMMDELKTHPSGTASFVTLTYDDEHLPSDESLVKRDLQLFFKRLRKHREVRYFACGEYGDTFGRPHYHAIIYGISPNLDKELVSKCWKNGLVNLGTVTYDSCCYVAKYMTKKLRGKALEEALLKDPSFKNEFVLMSRNPGIGLPLSQDCIDFMRENGFVWRKGHRSSIPRVYKDKYDIVGNLPEPQESSFRNDCLTQDHINAIVSYSRERLFGKA